MRKLEGKGHEISWAEKKKRISPAGYISIHGRALAYIAQDDLGIQVKKKERTKKVKEEETEYLAEEISMPGYLSSHGRAGLTV